MKLLVIIPVLLLAGVARAQTTDNLNVSPETVTIVDSTQSVAPRPSSYGETETIHVYSGQQSGNNIIRTYEVPVTRKDEYSPR